MEKYIQQLFADINRSTESVTFPFDVQSLELSDWLPDEEENKIAPGRNLEEWTGITKEQLPPAEMLSDEQVKQLLIALKKMLNEYNCSFVLQTDVPEQMQYECIRANFNQDVRVKRIHSGFFSLCLEGTEYKKCALREYCQCAFYEELFSQFTDEELSPEEERRRELEIEISHLKRKYDNDWMKYYPYHLDVNYDDENGNPYNYGFGEDDWWRK